MKKKFFLVGLISVLVGLISFLIIEAPFFIRINPFENFSLSPVEISKENFIERKEFPDCSILFNNAKSYQIEVLHRFEPTYFCFFHLENDKAQDFIDANGLILMDGMKKTETLNAFYRKSKKFKRQKTFSDNCTTQVYIRNVLEKLYFLTVVIEKESGNNNVYILIQIM